MKLMISNSRIQSGAALVISLIFLLIMTILALSMSQTTTVEEREAGNARDSNLAFQAAEAARTAGENYVINSSPAIDLNTLRTVDFANLSNSDSWWQSNGTEFGSAGAQDFTNLNSVASDPRYVVRLRARICPGTYRANCGGTYPITYYEVIARSRGSTADSEAVTASIYSQ